MPQGTSSPSDLENRAHAGDITLNSCLAGAETNTIIMDRRFRHFAKMITK